MNIEQLLEIRKNSHRINQLCNASSVVPFIGAGMSSDFYPMWRKFLEKFDLLESEQITLKDLLDNGKYEEAASFLYTLSEMAFIDTVKAEFCPSKIDSNKFNKSLMLLPVLCDNLIVTTNLDEVIENVWTHQKKSFSAIITPDYEDQFNDALIGNSCYLIKLHGTVRESSKYVLTKEQYDSYYGINSEDNIDFTNPFPRNLSRLLNARTLLFVGSSLKNDRVLHVLKKIVKWNKYTYHFAILSLDEVEENNTLRERELIEYGIYPIWFPANDYSSINVFLEEIIKRRKKKLSFDNKETYNPFEVPNTLPRTIPVFIGRDNEIDNIKKIIEENKLLTTPTVMISSIDGMPAVGKTTLAVRIAHIMKSDYPDAQLYIDCYGYTVGQIPLTSDQIIDNLLFSLGIPSHSIPLKFTDKLNLWRTNLYNKKVIVIFDNVKEESQINLLIPSSPSSLVLITSRNRLSSLVGIHSLNVNVLNEKASIELLERVSEKQGDEYQEIFSIIAKQYDYLPLALQIVASRIRGRSLKYIERLIVSPRPLDALLSNATAIYDSFNVSYCLLSDDEKYLMQIMSITPGINFTANSCAALIGTDVENIYFNIETLYDQRLIEEVDDDRYRQHDLLRDFAKKKYEDNHSSDDENNAILRLIDYYIVNVIHCNSILYPNQFGIKTNTNYKWSTGKLPCSENEAFTWLKTELENIFSCLKIALNNKWKISYWNLSHVLATFIRRSVSSWRVIDIHKIAYDFSIDMNNQKMVACSLTDLALAQHQAGDFYFAVGTFAKAEECWRSLNDSEGLAYTLSNHGFSLERLGDYELALNILYEALEINKKNNNKFGAAFTLNSIGAVHWRLGKYDIAKEIFIEAIEIKQEIKDFLGLGNTKNNLAFTYLKLGNEKKARKGFEESLNISQKYFDYNGQAVTLNNLGYTEIYCNNSGKAIKYAEAAYDIAYFVYDEYQIGRSFDVRGKAYLHMQNKEKAKDCLKKALSIFKKIKVPEANEVNEILTTYL